jgi:hypothetical protein
MQERKNKRGIYLGVLETFKNLRGGRLDDLEQLLLLALGLDINGF